MTVTELLSTKAFLTKAEVRDYIFVESGEPDRTDSELNALYRLVNSICAGCETYIRRPIIIQTGLIQYDDGGSDEIFLRRRPITSVTSVVESGVTLTVDTDYAVDLDLGIVIRIGTFASGTMANKITYNAGYGTQTRDGNGELTAVTGVPDDLKLAALTWLLQSWRHGPENYSPQQSETVGRWGTGIPKEVREILDLYKAPLGM